MFYFSSDKILCRDICIHSITAYTVHDWIHLVGLTTCFSNHLKNWLHVVTLFLNYNQPITAAVPCIARERWSLKLHITIMNCDMKSVDRPCSPQSFWFGLSVCQQVCGQSADTIAMTLGWSMGLHPQCPSCWFVSRIITQLKPSASEKNAMQVHTFIAYYNIRFLRINTIS